MPIAHDITTSLRLSRREAKLIRIGLFSITNGNKLWQARGSPSYSPARMLFQASRKDEGEYREEHLATLSRLAVTATFTSQSRRLRLDPFDLAAFALAARVTEMQVRHGHIEAWLPNHTSASRKLLAKLERLRKQAKRAFVGVHGHAAFTEASGRWQRNSQARDSRSHRRKNSGTWSGEPCGQRDALQPIWGCWRSAERGGLPARPDPQLYSGSDSLLPLLPCVCLR